MEHKLEYEKSMYMAQDWINMVDKNDEFKSHVSLLSRKTEISKRNNDKMIFFWIGISKDDYQMMFELNGEDYAFIVAGNYAGYFKYDPKDHSPLDEKAIDITIDEFLDNYDKACEQYNVQKIWR